MTVVDILRFAEDAPIAKAVMKSGGQICRSVFRDPGSPVETWLFGLISSTAWPGEKGNKAKYLRGGRVYINFVGNCICGD